MLSNLKNRIKAGFVNPFSKEKDQAKLMEAVALHQHGKLQEAQAIYESLISSNPKNADALHLLGVATAQAGKHQLAAELIARAIAVDPDNPAYYINRGNSLKELKQFIMAVASYDKAINLEPEFAEAYYSRGIVQKELRQFDAALASYNKAISIRPDYAEACYGCALVYQELQQYEAALASYEKAVAIRPDFAEAHYGRGVILQVLNRHQEALASYDKAILVQPGFALAYYSRGNVLKLLGQPEAAVTNYDRAIAINPRLAEAYYNRGNVLLELQQYEAAKKSYDMAISIRPESHEAYFNRANAHKALGEIDAALTDFNNAIYIHPGLPEAYFNRGNIFKSLGRLDEAVDSYDNAIRIKPDFADAHLNLGNVLQDMTRLNAALTCYDRAIAIRPDWAEAYNNRGVVLQGLQQSDAAIASYDRAINLKPDYTDAYYNRGNVLQGLKQLDAAVASFEQASSLKPDHDYLLGARLHAKMGLCDWSTYLEDSEALRNGIAERRKLSECFPVLSIDGSPKLQRTAAEEWIANECPESDELDPIEKRTEKDKIRVGYYSADFRNHAVSHLLAGVLEHHNKDRFEVIAFSYVAASGDEVRQRIAAACDEFHEVQDKSDKEVALLSRQLGIDIAIDLGGLTKHSRTGIFALRAAPIQVNYLGYPGTVGAGYIDYLIADSTIIPEGKRANYAEQTVNLPSYQPNDNKREIADRRFSRAELGLPEESVVFCSFNEAYKINPGVFDSWMRILKNVPGSVLWLRETNATASDNLRKEAAARGVDAGRLVFARQIPSMAEHLARHRAADLFLDTLPYNAHTSASDALWAGLPVLTRIGESFAGRVAASLLRAVGLPELITETQEQYEALAIELVLDPDRLRALREKLEQNRLSTQLFDTAGYTRNLEAAFDSMYQRYLSDLLPAHIQID